MSPYLCGTGAEAERLPDRGVVRNPARSEVLVLPACRETFAQQVPKDPQRRCGGPGRGGVRLRAPASRFKTGYVKAGCVTFFMLPKWWRGIFPSWKHANKGLPHLSQSILSPACLRFSHGRRFSASPVWVRFGCDCHEASARGSRRCVSRATSIHKLTLLARATSIRPPELADHERDATSRIGHVHTSPGSTDLDFLQIFGIGREEVGMSPPAIVDFAADESPTRRRGLSNSGPLAATTARCNIVEPISLHCFVSPEIYCNFHGRRLP